MNKSCVYNKEINCTGCDECYICDLNSNRRCNNCGKCLQLEGYDIRAIEVEDIFETQKDMVEYDELNELQEGSEESNDHDEDREGFWEFIDDIKELKDLVEEDQELKLHEEYPGLFVYKKTE